MGLLYRATTRLMNIGANPGTSSYDFSQNPERQNFEGFLESKRPSMSHSRLASWFACDSPERAARYLEVQLDYKQDSREGFLFAVEMPSPSKQPIVLVDAIVRALREDESATADYLANEYWQPTQPWRFWEYTSDEISTVRDRLELPDVIARSAVSMDYASDRKRLNEFLRLRADSV
jgi:hypothetical protein